MARSHQITINGEIILGRRGELLLDAAHSNGIDLPFDCRAGHCGACCVRLLAGQVHGGEGAEPGVVHACQGRIIADAVIETGQPAGIRVVNGVVSALHRLSQEVIGVGIRTEGALPYLAGQYAQVRFSGYPTRPYSLTHPLRGDHDGRLVWFHVRRVEDGRVSSSLGKRIVPGHRVQLTGPYGSAHFRPNLGARLILVATSTGFAPIWSIAVAALHENPERRIMIVAGGRSMDSLYMRPALARLARFPNVRILVSCSTPQTVSRAVKLGRPTDYLPRLHPSDVVYACGAPGMVDAVKEIAAGVGAACHSDAFLPATNDDVGTSVLDRVLHWLAAPTESARDRIAIASRQKRQLRLERPQRQQQTQASF
jgi:3-phenylpropionate/trans-cinnamate dioxygenase ferredoxin reductase subunit